MFCGRTMANNSDFLRVSGHKIFAELKRTLPDNLQTAQNLITIKDDVLYTWDFQSSCVLTLNVKSVLGKKDEEIPFQTLLPTQPPLHTPNKLLVNESSTLLVVAGDNGILVLELPHRVPPNGTFAGKEVVYCRSHSLDERLLACSHTEVRQVRFHPGSIYDTHIVVLTSDNVLRFYNVENASAERLEVYRLGRQPMGFTGGSNRTLLESLGETAIDFDFGSPEIAKKQTSELFAVTDTTEVDNTASVKCKDFFVGKNDRKDNQKDAKRKKWNSLRWPIYVLRGNGSVFVFLKNLYCHTKPEIRGPMYCYPEDDSDYSCNSCSILCLKTNPTVVICASKKGLMTHYIVLQSTDDEYKSSYSEEEEDEDIFSPSDRSLYTFETVELELGLATLRKTSGYYCPVFLHRDNSNISRYFATHNTGIHSVTIRAVDDLQKFVASKEDSPCVDVFKQCSLAEYLICTKTSSLDSLNPVVGFTLYYEPITVLALLADKKVITLSLMESSLLPSNDEIESAVMEEMNSPLKKMLREPFDTYIQKILKKVNTQPILKLPSSAERTQQECYELLQRASKVFREEYFKYYEQVREELEKRTKALQMLKKYQESQVEKMSKDRLFLKESAEQLAEKYEDIKDKQDELAKRSEKLLIAISQKKSEPSDAEKKFMEQLKDAKEKVANYQKVIENVKKVQKYNEHHMENWKLQNKNKHCNLTPVQTETIKSNLEESTRKIAELVSSVKSYGAFFNIQ